METECFGISYNKYDGTFDMDENEFDVIHGSEVYPVHVHELFTPIITEEDEVSRVHTLTLEVEVTNSFFHTKQSYKGPEYGSYSLTSYEIAGGDNPSVTISKTALIHFPAQSITRCVVFDDMFYVTTNAGEHYHINPADGTIIDADFFPNIQPENCYEDHVNDLNIGVIQNSNGVVSFMELRYQSDVIAVSSSTGNKSSAALVYRDYDRENEYNVDYVLSTDGKVSQFTGFNLVTSNGEITRYSSSAIVVDDRVMEIGKGSESSSHNITFGGIVCFHSVE